MNEPLLPVAEALRIVIAEASAVPEIEDADLDHASGRVLAEAVHAPADLPACDRSAMDGFAVRSADLAAVPAELDVVGFLPAGRPAEGTALEPGQAVRIMTGAPLPPGADAVQMVERTESLSDGRRVRILEGVRLGEHVFPRGADIARGSLLLEAGRPIRPAEIGALAAAGRTRVRVRRAPIVHLLSTGDEVVEPAAECLPHQVRNSNGPTLLAAMAETGVRAVSLGIARDDPRDLDAKISQGLAGDIFVVIGGVSVGDRDLVSARLQAAGVRVVFHRIAMKPGKPLLFGIAPRAGGGGGRCLVFGLPGNPLSSFTDFQVFVLPALRRTMGGPPSGLPEVRARLTETIRQKPGRTWYRLARIALEGGAFFATPVPSTGSGDLVSATRANGFAIVPAEVSEMGEGEEIRALLWRDFEAQ